MRGKEEKKCVVKKEYLFLIIVLLFLVGGGFVLAAPNFKSGVYSVPYYFDEDNITYYNFSENVTNSENISFYKIMNISSPQHPLLLDHSDYYWFPWNDAQFNNSLTSLMKINSTNDTMTGNFTLQVYFYDSNDGVGMSVPYKFIVNATNDAPEFLSNGINTSYILNQSELFLNYFNASDEESHYPLSFNITFWDNCTHASWANRNAGENCSLVNLNFSLTDLSDNLSAIMNFTPVRNDVGIYWANISVTDAGENYLCPHIYCSSSYEENKTTLYSNVVVFEIFSSLYVNVSDCQNKLFNESEEGICVINITTRGSNSNLIIESDAELRNYNTPLWINESWFYGTNNSNAENNVLSVYVNVTPNKTEIGNWTINFTVNDTTYNQIVSELINISVNKILSDTPDIIDIDNVNASISALTIVNFNITDDDFLIPDKNISYGGFNESLAINYTILNNSDLTQELVICNFSLEILNNPVDGTNRTQARLVFTPNSSESGNYTINITARDNESNWGFDLFNLTVKSNAYPKWNESLATNFSINEDGNLYLNLSENASDSDGDVLTFSYTLESGVNFTHFVSTFNSTTGEIDISPLDIDVGLHWVNITVSDGYLTNITQFNFTVNNIPDNLSFDDLTCDNATEFSNIIVNATEDNITKIYIWVQDEDLDIPSVQASNGFYQESLSIINTTVINSSNGQVINNLLNFTYDGAHPSDDTLLSYEASFTPDKSFVGQYNITFYYNDSSGYKGNHFFVLNINEINHNPVLSSVNNISSVVNTSVYSDFNASDTEDGNESQEVLVFNISFLRGDDFINGNESIFNTTSGILNMTFNDSLAGSYHLNLTVSDTDGLNDSGSFWIYIYDKPSFVYPLSGSVFNLTENQTSVLNFTVNHPVADNLTYEFWINSINCSYQNSSDCNYGSFVLRESLDSYGNNSNVGWSFTPNFTDESYGNLKNLTIKVYPNSSGLTTAQKENFSINRTFMLNITHTNYPVAFTRTIDNKGPVAYTTTIKMDLGDYFTDYDYFDSYYYLSSSEKDADAIINFSASGNATYIFNRIDDWNLTFSSSQADSGMFSVTVSSGSANVSSNDFFVEFSNPSAPPPVFYSSSSRVEVPALLKLILPGEVSLISNEEIAVPIYLRNDGGKILHDINLSGFVAKDSVLMKDFEVRFSDNIFSELEIGEQINTTMFVKTGLVEKGTYEITVNATVNSPKYNDWGKIYLKIRDISKIEERLLFAFDFILENPECAELTELIEEAKNFLREKSFDLALEKANNAVDACKKIIVSSGKSKFKGDSESKFYKYMFIVSASIISGGFLYYYYRKIRLKKGFINRKDLSKNKPDYD